MDATPNKQTPIEKQDKCKKRKQDEVEITSESDCESAGTSSVAGYVHFFVVEPLDGGSLSKYSPFVIQKFVQCRIGSVRAVKKLQSGSVLIEAANSSQASALNELNIFVDWP
jgi:hypothetical protein